MAASRTTLTNPESKVFFGERLELARTFRGITQDALAKEVCTSNALISYYENGKKTDPAQDLVEAWGEALGFETDFFFEPIQDPFKDEECSFRHRRTAPEVLKRRARAFGTLIGSIVGYLRTRLELPVYNVPAIIKEKFTTVEDAAQACRAHWGLGSDTPITHMGRVLENAGIPIVKTLASTEKVDAFSRRGPTPLVILNTFKQSTSHWIFDMAHELGHLVCHTQRVTGSMETEREADAFASAFLVPARTFSREFKSAPFSWEHMFELKARWQVSLAALVYRSYSLGLIDAITYRRAFQYLSARGWRKGEPHEPAPQEPELLSESLGSLYHDLGEHPLQLCNRLHFKPTTFEELTGITLPKQSRGQDVVPFQRVN
jgi:Zn-dependent peptidase ImmA (M78 family)/transcriptional regulator with XRE-family HTH domain